MYTKSKTSVKSPEFGWFFHPKAKQIQFDNIYSSEYSIFYHYTAEHKPTHIPSG